MRIGVIGMNEKTASLPLREKMANACRLFFSSSWIKEEKQSFILLSTCNRSEIYFSFEDFPKIQNQILHFLQDEISQEFENHLYFHFGTDCFRHLVSVTTGLDSAVPFETEIQRQVKLAYETSCKDFSLSNEMHFLFQKTLKIAKNLRSSLNFPRGKPSFEEVIYQIGSDFFNKKASKVLFVGASITNRSIFSHMRKKEMISYTFCNRSPLLSLGENDFPQIFWKDLVSWTEYDWIIIATKAPHFILPYPKTKLDSKKLIMDLSVPRNVDPSICQNQNITLLNIDELQKTLRFQTKNLQNILNLTSDWIERDVLKQVEIFHAKEKKKKDTPFSLAAS